MHGNSRPTSAAGGSLFAQINRAWADTSLSTVTRQKNVRRLLADFYEANPRAHSLSAAQLYMEHRSFSTLPPRDLYSFISTLPAMSLLVQEEAAILSLSTENTALVPMRQQFRAAGAIGQQVQGLHTMGRVLATLVSADATLAPDYTDLLHVFESVDLMTFLPAPDASSETRELKRQAVSDFAQRVYVEHGRLSLRAQQNLAREIRISEGLYVGFSQSEPRRLSLSEMWALCKCIASTPDLPDDVCHLAQQIEQGLKEARQISMSAALAVSRNRRKQVDLYASSASMEARDAVLGPLMRQLMEHPTVKLSLVGVLARLGNDQHQDEINFELPRTLLARLLASERELDTGILNKSQLAALRRFQELQNRLAGLDAQSCEGSLAMQGEICAEEMIFAVRHRSELTAFATAVDAACREIDSIKAHQRSLAAPPRGMTEAEIDALARELGQQTPAAPPSHKKTKKTKATAPLTKKLDTKRPSETPASARMSQATASAAPTLASATISKSAAPREVHIDGRRFLTRMSQGDLAAYFEMNFSAGTFRGHVAWSVAYHISKHAPDRVAEEYIAEARNAFHTQWYGLIGRWHLPDGTSQLRYLVRGDNGLWGAYTPDGKVLSYVPPQEI